MKTGGILLLLMLGMNALQDLKKREIFLLPVLGYSLVSLWIALLTGSGWMEILCCCLPGLFLLAVSLWTGGKVGMGDGWILLMIGLQLGFFPALLIFWGAVLLIAGWMLASVLWTEKVRRRSNELPMVPFFFLATVVVEVYSLLPGIR